MMAERRNKMLSTKRQRKVGGTPVATETKIFKFDNGLKVRDKITGFEGVITSRIEYINGCIKYGVQPRIDAKDPGKMPDTWYLDEACVEVVDEKVAEIPMKRTGGPNINASSMRTR